MMCIDIGGMEEGFVTSVVLHSQFQMFDCEWDVM